MYSGSALGTQWITIRKKFLKILNIFPNKCSLKLNVEEGGGTESFLAINLGRVVVPYPNSYKPSQAGLMGSYTVNENNIGSAVSQTHTLTHT